MLVKIFLFPFAIIYDGITRFRNYLFDINHKPSFEFQTSVISIGNLSVGGTGKTPMAEYLIRLLISSKRIATLSRGYGRRTRGFRFASTEDSAATIGDEPFQFYLKFRNTITVTVGEDRAYAIPQILHQFPETDVILMDDAFQHRWVKPQLSILLTEYTHPFYDDLLLPSGRLRESRAGAKRADAVVVTKCPQDAEIDFDHIARKCQRYAGNIPVFFSAIKYTEPIFFGKIAVFSSKVILVSGIANTQSLIEHVNRHFTVLKHFDFPDHHVYTKNDLESVIRFRKKAGVEVTILTTEKDMAKLIDEKFCDYVDTEIWYYLPIQSYFLKDGQKFDSFIIDSLAKSQSAVRN